METTTQNCFKSYFFLSFNSRTLGNIQSHIFWNMVPCFETRIRPSYCSYQTHGNRIRLEEIESVCYLLTLAKSKQSCSRNQRKNEFMDFFLLETFVQRCPTQNNVLRKTLSYSVQHNIPRSFRDKNPTRAGAEALYNVTDSKWYTIVDSKPCFQACSFQKRKDSFHRSQH